MRLSSRSVFLGIVAAGLPFAITIGWHAGQSPPQRPPAVPDGVGGSSRLGSSPVPARTVLGPVVERTPEPMRPVPVDTPTPRRSARPTSSVRPSGTATKPAPPAVTVPPHAVPVVTTVPPSDPPTPAPSGDGEHTPGALRYWR